MAEARVELNEETYISLRDMSSNQENESIDDRVELNTIDHINVSNANDLMMLDNAVDDVLQASKDGTPAEKDLNDSNTSEEGTVESPTTGDAFVYKCVFCDRVLTGNDDPKLLVCLHNACGSCVNNKIYEQSDNNSKGLLECAACGLIVEADKIIENQFLLEISPNEESNAAKLAEIKCSSCNDDAVAVSWCAECSEYICESCVQAHQRLKITKDHTIKTKEEGFLENQTASTSTGVTNLQCSIHPHEKLSLFCEKCEKLTCRDCQLTEHRGHTYKFTHEIASDTRKHIGAMLKDVTYKRVLLNSAMKVIADRQTLITDKKQALVKEITQLVVKLTNTINVRGKQLVARLTEVCDQKQQTLQEKKVALDQLSKMTDHCIEFTQHALDNGSDTALLYSKKQVTDHLQRIKSKRADIPNPEIPVRIHLALNKVPDLIKVISTIGQIVVDGRVYPTPSTSPATSLPPHGSPSPGHTRPPQQQSPINQPLQPSPQQQHGPPSYQQPRMLPPYGQQFSPNMGPGHNMQQTVQQNMQPNMQQNLGQKVPQNMGLNPNLLPHLSQSMPASLAQFQQNLPGPMQRMPMQRSSLSRPILPITRMPNPGMNHQQQQVSSSTHPQGLMQERGSLRGLLQPNGNAVYVQTGPSQYQAVQPQYAQQFQSRYPSQQVHYRQQTPMRMMPPNQQPCRMPMQQRMNTQPNNFQSPAVPGAKWHIPQQGNDLIGSHLSNMNVNRCQILPGLNDNFKITLKSPQNHDGKQPATVSSTIPKTPSPNHIQGKSDTERNLDKYCQDSVNDLMATIAKLDSNGVQVLAEGRSKTGGSPQVDSSTDDVAVKNKTDSMDTGKDDPNEDWCAVCMDGGELVCCDKCPKVFHQFCHIPNLSVEESDTWQCLLCMNFSDIPDDHVNDKQDGELTHKQKKIVERLILELYCQYEPSLPFREVIGMEHADYHSVIKKPIALDTVRHKLDWNSSEHYTDLEQLVRDVRLMFKNAYTFNEETTQVYHDARTLEKFFDEQLEKLLPQYAYEMFDDDCLVPPTKRYKRIISD